MTLFEKAVLPLIEKQIKLDDLTEESGFVDIYTSDPDHPGDYRAFYFVVNDNVRSGKSIDRARRFNILPTIKGTYTKRVNNIPYTVYRFVMPSKVAKMKDGIVNLSYEDKASVLQFWGLNSDIGRLLLSNQCLNLETEHAMPLADEAPIFLQGLLK